MSAKFSLAFLAIVTAACQGQKITLPKGIEGRSIVRGCTVLNFESKIVQQFPGEMCVFFPDGSYVSAGREKIAYFDHENHLKWSHKGFFHHQLAATQDNKLILAMSDESQVILGKKARIDRFHLYSRNGDTVFENTSYDFLKNMGDTKFELMGESDWIQKNPNVPIKDRKENELTHCNSFYEIPKLQQNIKNLPYIHSGNYIVNCLKKGFFILSGDLKKVLHFQKYPFAHSQRQHDAQISERGTLLMFTNEAMPLSQVGEYSAGHEMDLGTQRLVREFKSKIPQFFYSPISGSIQEIDNDYWFLFHARDGGFLVNKRTQKLIRIFPHIIAKDIVARQDARIIDLREFFSHRNDLKLTKQ